MSKQKITDEQFLEERRNGLTLKEIAQKYGMHVRGIEARSSKLAKKGYGHGSDFVAKHIPEGYAVKGTSTMIRADGEEVIRWVKSDIDRERQLQLMEQAMDAFCEEMPRYDPKPHNQKDYSEALCLYPVFDLHIGALAHKHECGENYSTDIAEKVFNDFIDYSTSRAPDSEKAVLLLGGDILHSDGLEAVTPASGHVLDQDSRYAKLVRVAIRAARRAVEKLLDKHEHVEVQVLEGNHDQSGMIWLRAMLCAFFENEPRVYVDVSPMVMHHTQYGKTFLAYTHGHTMKKAETRLAAAATDFRSDFGISKYVYTHSGHWHHQTVSESTLGIDEIHGQLGAKDAYSARGGWRSYRQAAVIVYDKEHGEVGRFTCRPEMFIDGV